MDNERRSRAGKGRQVLGDVDRQFVKELLSEFHAHSQRSLIGNMSPQEHTNHHTAFGELLPWFQAKKKREDKWAAILERMASDVFTSAVKAVLVFTALAIALGATGALDKLLGMVK